MARTARVTTSGVALVVFRSGSVGGPLGLRLPFRPQQILSERQPATHECRGFGIVVRLRIACVAFHNFVTLQLASRCGRAAMTVRNHSGDSADGSQTCDDTGAPPLRDRTERKTGLYVPDVDRPADPSYDQSLLGCPSHVTSRMCGAMRARGSGTPRYITRFCAPLSPTLPA
jgi:hypothetical protein